MEEYRWKRFQWHMERRHARRSLLKFLFLADQLIYFDLLGRMKALPYSQIGSYTKKRSCVVIRDRDGRRFAKVRKQLCSPRELEEQLREACPHLKWEGSP